MNASRMVGVCGDEINPECAWPRQLVVGYSAFE